MTNTLTASVEKVRKESVSEFIYGTITVLALLLVLDESSAGPWASVVTLVSSTYALAFTRVYANSVAEMLARRSRIGMVEVREIWREIRPLTVYAQLPTVALILAGIGIIPLGAAFWLANTIGVLMLFAAGAFVGVRAGFPAPMILASGLSTGAVGVLIIVLKALTH